MAQESRKPRNLNGAYAISESTLRRAIKALTEAGVIKIRATVRGPDDGWKQANDYVIDYDYTDRERIMEAWEMGKRERRRERERRGNASRLANLPPADDEAARIAAELQDYGDPLDCDDPWCVCEGDQETHRWWQALPGVEKARRTEEGRFRPDA
jgi:hypothetical protein